MRSYHRDVAGKHRRSAWLRPAAMLSAVAMTATLSIVGGATSVGASTVRADASTGFLACEVTDTGGISVTALLAFTGFPFSGRYGCMPESRNGPRPDGGSRAQLIRRVNPGITQSQEIRALRYPYCARVRRCPGPR